MHDGMWVDCGSVINNYATFGVLVPIIRRFHGRKVCLALKLELSTPERCLLMVRV